MVPPGSMFAGTCTGPTVVVQGMTVPTCVGGFRNGGPCAANTDCEGSLASSMPLLYSRGEMRSQFKINLQQSTMGGIARVTWPIDVEKNPANPAHVNSWDQATVCITNPMTGETGACTDGGQIKTTIHKNQLLGYTSTALADLMNPATVGIAKATAAFTWTEDPVVSKLVNFDASSSTCGSGSCTYSWNFGDGSTASGATITHGYASAGLYSVTLTVNDTRFGFTATTTSQVEAELVNNPPIASKTSPLVSGMTVTFQDMSSDVQDVQSNLNVTVNWGDGTTSTGKGGDVFTKTYAAAGTYTIRHSVTDSDGMTSSSPNSTVSITEKFAISGAVVDSVSAPVAGAKLSLKIGYTIKSTTLSASDGTYAFNNLLKGCYTVVPSMTGKTFTPASKYLCVGPSSTSINFTAAP